MPEAKERVPTGLHDMPGHYIRRLQQIAVAVFLQEAESFGVTPIQYAVLQAVREAPGSDQRSLAGMIGLDTSTMAGVVERLESRGLLHRGSTRVDRRVRILTLTEQGQSVVVKMQPLVDRAQQKIMAPLSKAERREFMRMMKILVSTNNDLSRAPSEGV
ncbi:MAG: MarR family transcriptional regulator [Betaproteobacteria bacterium]|nr:MarR family transcriptional regulator [Betaproteobacteria bacterium]